MTKELMRDLIFLARKLEPATNEDLQVPQDLLDMLIANKDGCVDMTANGLAFACRSLHLIMRVHIGQCSTLKLSKSQDRMIPRQVSSFSRQPS